MKMAYTALQRCCLLTCLLTYTIVVRAGECRHWWTVVRRRNEEDSGFDDRQDPPPFMRSQSYAYLFGGQL